MGTLCPISHTPERGGHPGLGLLLVLCAVAPLQDSGRAGTRGACAGPGRDEEMGTAGEAGEPLALQKTPPLMTPVARRPRHGACRPSHKVGCQG